MGKRKQIKKVVRPDATRSISEDTMHVSRYSVAFIVLGSTCFGQKAWADAGRSLYDTCFPLCAGPETDPDERGVVDGWGWEHDASCIVPGSALEAQGEACDFEPAPVVITPPNIPEGPLPRPEGGLSTGFFTVDGRLCDAWGNDFVMRGVNHPVVWHPAVALAWLDEIALTGANSVRLVWETGHPTQTLRDAVARSIELQMVPMIELHDISDGTGIDQPSEMAAYYAGELRNVLLEFEGHLLINIANEWNGGLDVYSEAYRRAITLLRDAGINHTLVIDANGFGQAGETLISEGPALLQFDPQHNLVFSVHMYEEFEQPEHILDILRRAVEARIPFVIGEFAFTHGHVAAIPFPVMLEEAERLGLGYLAWVWSGHNPGDLSLDLSVDGSAAQLTPWGNDLVNGPFGIRATSRPASIFLQAPAEGEVDVPEVDVPEVEAIDAGGLLLWEVCFPLCASAETDPDEFGNVDGWGYEDAMSCLVPGSVLAAEGSPCLLPPD